jgi:hypothetical protein
VVPGTFNQNDISKKIYRIYADELNDPRFVKQIASPDQIAMMVPPGESDLKSQKPERKGERIEHEGGEYGTPEVEDEPEDDREEIEGEFGNGFGEKFVEEAREKVGKDNKGKFEENIKKKPEEIIETEARGREEEIKMHGVKKV